ncbi:hypothetical protein KUTeg_019213 [Tegillarca granosa]|uniref:Zinc finger protein ush n=1 Tax=Tegillarca granosa TaxID=220873 RepID=A0ABQ9EGW1_TEGGR|nr:hypothetical protein KUTeg_019213 [Tegillarca granosa]
MVKYTSVHSVLIHADKSSSLNRHKRIHNRGSNPEEIMKYSLSVPKNDTYCKDCNIQFSSLSTYKCHREYYCSKRRFSVDSTAATSGSESSPSPQNMNTSPIQESSTFFSEGITTLKPDDLKKVISVSSGSMLSSQTRVLLAPPILAPNGVGDMTMGMPTVIVQPIVAATSALAAHQNAIKHNPKKTTSQAEQPLDLSTSKKDEKSESEEYRPESSESGQCTTDSVKIKEECITPQTSPKIKSPPSTPVSDTSSPTKSSASTPGAKSLPEMPPLMTVHQLPYICGKPIPPMLQSVSKCTECNIVFYKHENYLIHKKHYCSSRRGKMESPDNYDTESSNDSYPVVNSASATKEDLATRQIVSPRKPPNEPEKESVSTPVPGLKSPRTESKVPEEVFYKYYCVPCKIKFSSSSTLKAHKEFYCPHGKESGKTIIAKKTLEEISNSPKETDDELFKCDRCESEFMSGRLLKLHFCTGVSSATPLLRCPYCEFVTQVESRISEHMKVHMPNKVYRCTLCRYRGNTVRGMRMHGKMHLDNGEDFTDENMIEIEEPPLIPVKLNNNGDNRPVDIETELLRLKNEPYKRRRSRKSFEKSEHASSVTNVCMFCGQKFRDFSSFALHLKIHEMIALQAAAARNIKCQYCDTVSENFDDLLQHIQVHHQDKIMMEQRSPSSQGQSSRSNSRSSLSNSRPGSVGQSEINDMMTQKETLSPPLKKIKREQSDRSTPNEEANICSKTEPVSALVKEEPLDCSSYQQTLKDENQECHQEIKRNEQSNSVMKERRSSETSSSETDVNSANIQQTSSPRVSDSGDETEKISKTIKTETTMNGSLNHSPPINVPVFDPQQLIPYYHLLPGMSGLSHLVSVSVQNSISPSRSEKPTAKYCTHCDIKFTYQSSYLAHKKYYCSSRTPSEGQATSPVS